MNVSDLEILTGDRKKWLIRIRDWFEIVDSIDKSLTWNSTKLGGELYTISIIVYLDEIISKGHYDSSIYSNTLNWMRELYIVNHKTPPHLRTPIITTI
jgi:hypothetical protein